MPRFSGYGPGKGAWTKRRYDRDGNVVAPPPPPKRTPALHTRFQPFTSMQVDRKTRRELGLPSDGKGGTVFTHERQLNRYMAFEKHHGREVHWKQHSGDD